jgi:hypothetical protein
LNDADAIEPPIVSDSRVAAVIRLFMLVLVFLVLPMLLLAATTHPEGCGGG